MQRSIQALVAVLGAAALAVSALAASSAAPRTNDAHAALGAKVSLVEATQAAEASVGGKATHAEFEQSEQHGPVYEVEVARADRQVFDVRVGADNGQILSSRTDSADHADDDEDKEEG